MRNLYYIDQICGAIVGAAIGDAMGHPTEFLNSFEIQEKFGENGVEKYELYRQDNEGITYAPYTDDTQLAEIVLRTLIDTVSLNWDLNATMLLMSERFIEWRKNPQGGHRGPGRACIEGCYALEEGTEWSKAGHIDAGGCGSVMRSYPYGLAYYDNIEKAEFWAAEGSKPTHRHSIALAASAAMAVGTALAIKHTSIDDIIDKMAKAAEKYDFGTAAMICEAYADAVYGVEPSITLERLQGWAAHEAISAAVYIFVRHYNNPSAAILEGANAPGDSDSIASIVGALVGAWNGLNSFPKIWVTKLERNKELIKYGFELASMKLIENNYI
jgi:ADP-ribosyl-[dinitrogen reductase] hydrolase